MAAREHEEEQTQRTMLALNNMQASYPNKSLEEVKQVVKEVSHNKHNSVKVVWFVDKHLTKSHLAQIA